MTARTPVVTAYGAVRGARQSVCGSPTLARPAFRTRHAGRDACRTQDNGGSGYVGTMDDETSPGPLDIFDEHDLGLVCRVCGAVVPHEDRWARVHWDWHEATNGA
jgi:hypothetical protein